FTACIATRAPACLAISASACRCRRRRLVASATTEIPAASRAAIAACWAVVTWSSCQRCSHAKRPWSIIRRSSLLTRARWAGSASTHWVARVDLPDPGKPTKTSSSAVTSTGSGSFLPCLYDLVPRRGVAPDLYAVAGGDRDHRGVGYPGGGGDLPQRQPPENGVHDRRLPLGGRRLPGP